MTSPSSRAPEPPTSPVAGATQGSPPAPPGGVRPDPKIQRGLENARNKPPADLEALRKNMWREHQDLQRRINELKDQNADRENDRGILENSLKALQKKVDDLEVQPLDKVGDYPDYQNRDRVIENTKKEINRLKEEIGQLDEAIRRGSTDISTLAEQQAELGRYLGPMEGLAH